MWVNEIFNIKNLPAGLDGLGGQQAYPRFGGRSHPSKVSMVAVAKKTVFTILTLHLLTPVTHLPHATEAALLDCMSTSFGMQ